MKIYTQQDNIYDAVDAMVKDGVVAVGGMKTSAVAHLYRIQENLQTYDDVASIQAFHEVANHGYLYFLYDSNRLSFEQARQLVEKIDKENPL